MSKITTQVLDLSTGRPAVGIHVKVSREETSGWLELGTGVTDTDGRVRGVWSEEYELRVGVYRITFETGAYFASQRADAFYPEVTIQFEIRHALENHHLPLLVSPYGYSTYRGT